MKNKKIAIIGLGYVGLPLARLFATKYPVIGFDINTNRVAELKEGHDSTLEVADEVLKAVLLKENVLPWLLNPTKPGLHCSAELSRIGRAHV